MTVIQNSLPVIHHQKIAKNLKNWNENMITLSPLTFYPFLEFVIQMEILIKYVINPKRKGKIVRIN